VTFSSDSSVDFGGGSVIMNPVLNPVKSFLTSGMTSLTLHAGIVGAFVAISTLGPALSDPIEVGIQVVREAGDPEMRVQPPTEEADVLFDRLETRVELEHPVPFEDVTERMETTFDVEKGLPEPRPVPPEPVLDRPVRVPVVKLAPTPAATDTAPSEITNPPPEYPSLARRRGYEGSVVLEFEIRADGSCGDVRVTRSSGYDILDEAAVRAVRGWRFNPATRAGKPVAAVQSIRFTFKLQG
jgi:protein TonB